MPRLSPTNLDIAYAAGLFDGEGHVWIGFCTGRGGRKGVRFGCMVAMTTPAPVLWLKETFGGGMNMYTSISTKPVYRWSIYSGNAAAFLMAVQAYLKVKHEEARIALEFHATIGYGKGGVPADVVQFREGCISELKEARKRAREVQKVRAEG